MLYTAENATYLGLCRLIEQCKIALVVFLTLLCSSAWASAQAEGRAPAPSATLSAAKSQQPVDFRCDNLEVTFKGESQYRCRGHVVLRQEDLLLCCNMLTGKSTQEGAIESVACAGDVRLRRGDETVWATHGQYNGRTGIVLLTGQPLLERAANRLTGELVTIVWGEQHARITRPRGQVVPASESRLPALAWPQAGPLPSICPIGPRPPTPL